MDEHLRATRNAGGPVGDAKTFLLDARALHDHAVSIMERLARDDRVADELEETENER